MNNTQELDDNVLNQVTGGKVKGARNMNVSFDDCPQGEDFSTDVCKYCQHRYDCWPTGILGEHDVN